MRKKYTKKCKFCGGAYHPFYGEQIYCSRSCRAKDGISYHKTGKFVKCKICEKEIWRKGYLIKKYDKFFCSRDCHYKYRSLYGDFSQTSGSNNWNWKGGISFIGKPLYKQIRKKKKYIQWRKSVFERDNYTCLSCGKRGAKLNVDHYPQPFSEIIKMNNINTIEKAYECKDLWDENNGRTLCEKCHKLIGWKGSWVYNFVNV